VTAPRKPDRIGLWATLTLWVMALVGLYFGGLEVTDTIPKRWLGHWITIIWAFIGWLPLLIFLRRPRVPKDRP
jgi:hypothetical protein